MRDYHEHADLAGLERRLRVLASHTDRATMLRTLEERDIGCVTLTMPKHALHSRLREAQWQHADPDEGTAHYGGWDY